MQDVADEAGVSRGALYRHFAGREGLVDAVLERTLEDLLEAVAREVDSRDNFAAQVAAAIRLMPSAQPEPLASVLEQDPSSRAGWLTQRWRDFWEPRLEGAQQRGEVRDDLDVPDAADWIARVQLSFMAVETLMAEENEAQSSAALEHYVDENLVRGLGA